MGTFVIVLELLDPLDDQGEVLDWYHKAKYNQFKEAFAQVDAIPHKAQALVTYRKPTSGWTALHQAAFFGDQWAVNQLLQRGTQYATREHMLGAKSRGGQTPQQVAQERGFNLSWA